MELLLNQASKAPRRPGNSVLLVTCVGIQLSLNRVLMGVIEGGPRIEVQSRSLSIPHRWRSPWRRGNGRVPNFKLDFSPGENNIVVMTQELRLIVLKLGQTLNRVRRVYSLRRQSSLDEQF